MKKQFLPNCKTLFAGPKPQHSEVPKIWPFILATTLQFKSVSYKYDCLFNHFHNIHKQIISNTCKIHCKK